MSKACLLCGLRIPATIVLRGLKRTVHPYRLYCFDCVSFGHGNQITVLNIPPVSRLSSGSLQNQNRKKLKTLAVDYKGGKCLVCGYDKYVAALDFHHRDKATKKFNISSFRGSIEKLKPELDKCDLLCCRCHREIHYT